MFVLCFKHFNNWSFISAIPSQHQQLHLVQFNSVHLSSSQCASSKAANQSLEHPHRETVLLSRIMWPGSPPSDSNHGRRKRRWRDQPLQTASRALESAKNRNWELQNKGLHYCIILSSILQVIANHVPCYNVMLENSIQNYESIIINFFKLFFSSTIFMVPVGVCFRDGLLRITFY